MEKYWVFGIRAHEDSRKSTTEVRMKKESNITDASKNIEISDHCIRYIVNHVIDEIKDPPSDGNTPEILTKGLLRLLNG